MSAEGTDTGQNRVGDRLRKAREARGLSLNDVHAKIHIRTTYLQGVEDMYLAEIPDGYLNGILRNYSTFLNMAPEEVIEDYAAQCGMVSQAKPQEVELPAPTSEKPKLRNALLATAAAFIIALSGGTFLLVSGASDKTSAQQSIEAGTPINGARESLLATAERDELSAQLPLRLTATKAGWLEVRGADGTIFRSRKMAEGENYFPRIGAGWTVTSRDGGAFVWHVGDVEIGPMGEAGTAVYALSVDAIALDAQAIATPALAAVGESQPTR